MVCRRRVHVLCADSYCTQTILNGHRGLPGRREMPRRHTTPDEIVAVVPLARQRHVACRSAPNLVQPHRDVLQRRTLHFLNGPSVSKPHREGRHGTAVGNVLGVHVHGQPLLGLGDHFQTLRALVVGANRDGHTVHEVLVLVNVFREEHSKTTVNLRPGRLRPTTLHHRALVIVVGRVGFPVERHLANALFVSVLEQHLHGQLVHQGRRSPRAGHYRSLLTGPPHHVQDVPGGRLLCNRARLAELYKRRAGRTTMCWRRWSPSFRISPSAAHTSAADHNQPPDSQNRVWDREARCSHYCTRKVPTESKIAWPPLVVPRSTVPGTCSWTQRTIESSTRASNDALGHGNGKLHQKSEKHFSQSALWASWKTIYVSWCLSLRSQGKDL